MSRPPIRLVALDLDGTLYANEQLGVPQSAWAAIERAQHRGIRFAVCTGRPLGGFGVEYAQRLDPLGLHVFNDGSTITNALGQPHLSIPLPHLEALIQLSRQYRIPLELLGDRGGRFVEEPLIGLEHNIALTGVEVKHTNLSDLLAGPEVITRAWTVVPDPDHFQQQRHRLEALPNLHRVHYELRHVVVSGYNRLGVGKGSGLRYLAQHHGLPIEQVAMIGDGDNDRSAFRVAGLAIAMGNSEPELLGLAHHVTGRADQDGLAQAIEYILEHAC
jgi:Cof subfamily protein (haloacid dehalogenase superfamily)